MKLPLTRLTIMYRRLLRREEAPLVSKCPRVAVISDNCEMMRILSRILQLEGYHVAASSDDNRVMALRIKEVPDLIIFDVTVPGTRLFPLARLIEDSGNIPVIILAADLELITADTPLDLSADDYVKKPFNRAEFLARIRDKLGLAESANLEWNLAESEEYLL